MRRFSLFFYCLGLILFSSTSVLSQDNNPLGWTEPINVKSNDIFIMWMESAGYSYSENYQKVYGFDYNSSFLPADSLVTRTPKNQDSRIGGGSYTDAATGKFAIGPRDNVVSIWGGDIAGTSRVNIMLPKFDTTETMWTNSIQDSITTDVQNDRMYVRTLDIDGDSLDEFIIAFLNEQDSIQFYLYDVDSDLNPTLILSFSDEKVIND